MIKHGSRYTRTIVEGDKFLEDTGNEYMLISQRKYKGKTDRDGNPVLEPGVTVTLQIMRDTSQPIVDKETGLILDDNALETFEATIVDCPYPLPYKKGDRVSLHGFLTEHSYYINFNFILRFLGISRIGDAE